MAVTRSSPIPAFWKKVLAASADPTRATHHFHLLAEAAPAADLSGWDPDAAAILAAVLAGSASLTALLAQNPSHLGLLRSVDTLREPRSRTALEREWARDLEPLQRERRTPDYQDRLHALRLRELLRIGARDLGRVGRLPDLLREISDAADLFLQGVLDWVWPDLVGRHGDPWHRDPDGDWQRTAFSVLGLGKLGGQELNYSSDVDLLFVYDDEGSTFRAPPKGARSAGAVLSNHQFFKRVGEALIREATARGPQAGGLRVDLRLRPEGDSGPLARSLDSYENFYAEWGQTWERMMLLKARCVAGDPRLAGEFLEVVQSFRYPRSLGEHLLGEMAEMKARIEREVVRAGEIDRNVKLGRGGIREIEFVAQALQVLHGGRNPFVQSPHTLVGLPKLAAYGLLPEDEASCLAEAYDFLRSVEHRLQMDEFQQTHSLPTVPAVLERVARLMGCTDRREFANALQRRTSAVRRIYERVLGPGAQEDPDPLPRGFAGSEAEAWRTLLTRHRFRDVESGVRLVRGFLEGSGVGHVSRRTGDLGRQLIGRILELCPDLDEGRVAGPKQFVLSDPDRVLARLDSYIATYGARASLYELWTSRPTVFEHLVKLFDRSEFLAELVIREPDLVDELEAGGHLGRSKDATTTLADLRHGRDDADQHLWLRRYFQTEFVRLGLRDILGQVDFQEANRELSALAEACVQYAVEVVTRRAGLRTPPFAVIALGKFGGAELVYGSDLDVIFVAPGSARNIPRLQKLAREVIDLLSARTAQGALFELDARLRPDGEKGLLVNTLPAHEEYYRSKAMLWEIQALTRARAVAGHRPTGAAFERLAAALTDFGRPSLPLAAFTPEWKRDIARMRRRIERERTPAGRDALAFKTGAGGLIDAEFIAQALAMEHGWFEPNTLASLERGRHAGHLGSDGDRLIEAFLHLRRMESTLRRWSFEGETALPEDPAPQYRVAARCGYPEAAALLRDAHAWRATLRAAFTRLFPTD